ncbi:Hypp1942 [Branchiostoma lanceolatum]|uniref:Hypp1942 protein n=1 Tax=Branchiostoma lanceolatum TaxID=7740 RepID=A0A8J9ZPE0_BRALA|nr:Hypp1942 [Branchiostoma lanceolatum]
MLRPMLLIVFITMFAPEAHGKPRLARVRGKQQDVRNEADGGTPTEATPGQSQHSAGEPEPSPVGTPSRATLPLEGRAEAPRRHQRGVVSLDKQAAKRHRDRARTSNRKLWLRMLGMRRMANLSYLAFPIAYLMEPPMRG